MNISKSDYLAAVRKLNTSMVGGYDEKGLLKPECALTKLEKDALFYYVEQDLYKKDSFVDKNLINNEIYKDNTEPKTR